MRVTVTDAGVTATLAGRGDTSDRPGEYLYVENPEENTVDVFWCDEDGAAAEGKRLRPGEGFGVTLEVDEVVELVTATGESAANVEIVRTGVTA